VANTTTYVLPKLLAQGVLALRQNAIMPRVVNRDYSGLAAMKGNAINVPIPSAITATDVAPGVTTVSNNAISPTSAIVTLDFWKSGDFYLTDKEIQDCMEGVVPMQASEAIKALANAVDSYILGKAVGVFAQAGTAATTPFATAITVFGEARMKLNRQKAPLDNRVAVFDPLAEANLLLVSPVLLAQERGDPAGVISGAIGRKLGFDVFMDQNITTYTPGTGWASGFIASTVGGAVGDTTLNLINASASGTIKIGDVFYLTADSVNKHQYVVTANATASSTVAVAISFYPALQTTVATGATLVVTSVAFTRNLAFHRDAFAWASRPMQDVLGLGNQFSAVVDPVSGIALRLEVSREWKQTTFSYDILGGAQLIRPDLAVSILG
jgi:hypothetical protein